MIRCFRPVSLQVLLVAAGHLRWQSFYGKNACLGFLQFLVILPAFLFLIPANLLVFKSVTIEDKVFVSTASTNSGRGNILFSSKYLAYLPTLSFS